MKPSDKFRYVPVPREDIAQRLHERRVEIEQTLLVRTTAFPDPRPSDDPEYLEGIRTVIRATFDYFLAVITSREGEIPPIPAEILNQARVAARRQVELDVVLRGYVAGSALLDSYIFAALSGGDPQPLLSSRAVALELMLSSISAEYIRERDRRGRSREERDLHRVTRILRGDQSQIDGLIYDLDLNHVGLVVRGPDVKSTVCDLSKELDSTLLLVRPDEATAWAWLGRHGPIYADDVQAAATAVSASTSVAIGEAAPGVVGWRHTHHQAKTAFAVAIRSTNGIARYADVCLLASALENDLLAWSLREIYLRPLMEGKDGGATHLRTLRAYFANGRSGVSTASTLRVSRQTVSNRLRTIEDLLGRSLGSCAAAVEVALQLELTE